MKLLCKILPCLFFVLFGLNSYADFVEELQLLYRIDLLPRYRENTVVGQVSSYDRTGRNDDGFSGKYSYIRKEKGNLVIADLKGPGIIERIWTPTPTRDTVDFYFDGESKPRISIPFIDLFTGKEYPFVKPIVGNEVGGYYNYVPIPYQKSCKVIFRGKEMKFFQLQYREFAKNKSIRSFPKVLSAREKSELAQAVKVWSSYGTDLMENISQGIEVQESTISLAPGNTKQFFELTKGGRIVGLELTPLTDFPTMTKNIILKARWDGEKTEAINAPITDFFGYAFGKPAMRGLLAGTRENVHYSYIPMPFDQSGRLELSYLNELSSGSTVQFRAKVFFTGAKRNINEGKLYVKWRREINPPLGKPFTMLEANGKGHHIGTILQSQGLNPGITGFFEGDDSTVVDGQLRIHGTGSEDYFNGGWYAMADRWDQGYNLPIHGALNYSIPLSQTGGYRFYLTDKVNFNKSYFISIEHGPEDNKEPVDYTSVAFYYSDTPPTENNGPTRNLITINPPTKLEYLTQLLPINAITNGASLKYGYYADDQTKNNYDAYHFTGVNEKLIKFELEVPANGKYRLFMSYFKNPSGGNFTISQRQNPIKNINTKGSTNRYVDRELVGELNIENGTNTVSIMAIDNPGETPVDFILHKINLEKL